MTTDDMDQDLKRFSDFEQLSDRVNYWRRRFALTKPTIEDVARFDEVVGHHSRRVLSVLRAG